MNYLQNLLVKGEEGEEEEESNQQQLSQDELRRRRLARYEPQSATTTTTAATSTTTMPPITTPATSLLSVPAQQTIATNETLKKEKKDNSSSVETPSPAKLTSPSTTPLKEVVQKTTVSPGPDEKTKKDLVNEALMQFLRLSLAPTSSKQILYLPLVAAEEKSKVLNESNLDAVICGRLYGDVNDFDPRPMDSPLRYIMGCFDRLPATRRNFRAEENQEVASALDYARSLLINFVVTYLSDPSLFPSATLARWSNGHCAPEHEAIDLLRRPESSANFIHLLQIIFSEVIKQGCGKQIVLPILEKLALDQKAQKNESFEYVLSQLCAARVDKVGGWGQFVAEILADERQKIKFEERKSFFEPISMARRFEMDSILGVFFSTPSGTIEPGTPPTKATLDAKRKILAARLQSLKQLTMDICRASESAREEMLKWFEKALELNAERSKDRPDRMKCSSDSFAHNLCSVLLHLCEPFLSSEKSMTTLPTLINETMDCISNCKAYPSDLTLLQKKESASDQADPPATSKKTKKSKFATQAFTLALRAVELGPIVSYRSLSMLHRQLRYVRDELGEQSAECKSLVAIISTIVCFGFEPGFVDSLLSFASLTSRWFMHQQLGLSDDMTPWNDKELPSGVWTTSLQPKLAKVPEFIVSQIPEIFVQVGQHDPSQFDIQGAEKLKSVLDFFIFSIGCGDYVVGGPHIRANMGDALFYAFLPEEAQQGKEQRVQVWSRKGIKEMVLESSKISIVHLVPNLMKLYGDVQVTGYYQVAAHRQLITKILGYLWVIDAHRPAFRSFAETSLKANVKEEESAFVKLANGILNQTNSNVAESLAKLREIRITQVDMKNAQVWGELTEEERNQRIVLLEANEKEVAACLMMANDATDMLSYLSSDPTFVKAFTIQALRSRLVDMLCCILSSLGSKKAAEFKIDNPEKYQFYPKKMLGEIFQTLLNCAKVVKGAEEDAKLFVQTVAASAYYDHETFLYAANLVKKYAIVQDEKSVELFLQFVEDCEKAKEELRQEEEDLGEIPDEFLDPLLSELMDDPVILPGSKMTVNRSTIMHQLLQNPSDPFDRSPLDASQLKENTELKQKIAEWKAQKGKKH